MDIMLYAVNTIIGYFCPSYIYGIFQRLIFHNSLLTSVVRQSTFDKPLTCIYDFGLRFCRLP